MAWDGLMWPDPPWTVCMACITMDLHGTAYDKRDQPRRADQLAERTMNSIGREVGAIW